MSNKPKLKVLPVKDRKVNDYNANRGVEGQRVRYLGHKFNAESKEFELVDGVVEVEHRPEYIRELQSGGLLPADEATAKLAGVVFKKEEAKVSK